MKKIKRALIWAIINGAFGYTSYLAITGNNGASNLLTFLAAANFILTAFVSICVLSPLPESKEFRKKMQDKGRAVPGWLALGFDAALICACIWQGWYFTGTVSLIQSILESAMFYKEEEKPEPPTP